MDSRFHGLPPSKRFKILQENTQPKSQTTSNHSCLPAKKRIDSWNPPTPICLPAKKRIWAPPPLQEHAIQEEEKPTKHPPLQEEEKEKPTKKTPPKAPLDLDLNFEPISNTHCNDCEADEEDGIICAICQSTDGDPSDPIVFCDGCDLMVHASCYGNPLIQAIPEGDWYCSRCESAKARPEGEDFSCCLCPIKGGPVKPTVDGRWAHVMCVLLVPEVFFRDSTGRDGIDCSGVPRGRWEGVCYICESRSGCVIDCSEPKCSSRFHVSCGSKEDLCIEYREAKAGGIVVGFCDIHTQLWEKQQLTGKFKFVPREKK
eukprot:TRINITY_DN38258_c0_g1_i1.p1 TRINITY_DN38258_c0_g1~~TRINITY_DN38258_c0_g1_i1.p1  ORF type:complete len:315 (+),score=53.53 TRINITY_DN38258_c0_g1_i1:74-1018(+)